MKRATMLFAAAAVLGALASVAFPPARLLVWNITASVPTGLYRIEPARDPRIGDRVAIAPPPQLRAFLAERGYLPSGVPLLKEIAALEGQRVCRMDLAITIDGELRAAARAGDTLGRALPVWDGCRTLGAGEVFVLNAHAPGSFDGRYFGPLARSTVIGRAVPVWTDETQTDARAARRPGTSNSQPTPQRTPQGR